MTSTRTTTSTTPMGHKRADRKRSRAARATTLERRAVRALKYGTTGR